MYLDSEGLKTLWERIKEYVKAKVPTRTSQLTNDSGFIADSFIVRSFNGMTGEVEYTSPVTSVNGKTGAVTLNIPTVPTRVSELQNDAGYITTHQSLDGFATQTWVQSQGYVTANYSYSKSEINTALNSKADVSDIPDLTAYATKQWVTSQGYMTEGDYYTKDEVDEALEGKADVEDIPSLDGYATQQWVGQQGYITAESDPTVPSWAKQSAKPTYTAQEVGALPSSTSIPTKTSDLTNDSGFLTQHQSLSGYATEQWVENKGYLTSETDPVFGASAAAGITSNDIDNWNGKLNADATAKKTSSIPFAVVDSTSTNKVFTATVPGITELVDGTCVLLRNSVVTSAAGFTININGLGAHPAFNNMTLATADTTIFNVNYTMLFVYCANVTVSSIKGAWCCYRGYDSAGSNTIGYQIRGNSGPLPVSDTARYYKIYFTSADGSKWVPASVNSTNNATSARPVNQRPINPFGPIVYTSANTNYTAGTSLAASTAWQQYAITFGYSFNRTGAALTLSYPKPVYIKCAPQSDGSAIMDEDTPYVQALPSTEDGKIYIFLGIAYSATAIELRIEHPVYYFKDNAIRLWTNQVAGGGSITIDSTPTSGSTNAVSSGGVYTALVGKADTSSLATVATSGSYDDLDDKPTIPTVPTNVSAFTNDAGYLTSHQDISGKESTSNKVTSLSSSSTDTQYPSAKCVYDIVGDIQTALTAILS